MKLVSARAIVSFSEDGLYFPTEHIEFTDILQLERRLKMAHMKYRNDLGYRKTYVSLHVTVSVPGSENVTYEYAARLDLGGEEHDDKRFILCDTLLHHCGYWDRLRKEKPDLAASIPGPEECERQRGLVYQVRDQLVYQIRAQAASGS